MVSDAEQGELFERGSVAAGKVGVVVINERCRMQTVGGYRVVTGCGVPVAHYAVGDRMGEAHAMVSLVELGWAKQTEVATAFGCDERTVRRNQRRFESAGLSGLGRPSGYPKGSNGFRAHA